MNLKVKYLGLELPSPVVVSSSPFNTSADKIAMLEKHGAGAVVLKSVFEEQIMGETAFLERYNDYPEAADYLKEYVGNDYLKGHLSLIEDTKKRVGIPVIASINCLSAGTWAAYAKSIESAGADALELNIFMLPTSAAEKSADIEKRYLGVVENVVSAVKIPVSVKLGAQFTNILSVCREIYYRKARGVVMFNRFFEPDIDVDTMSLVSADPLSSRTELRNSLRPVSLCVSQTPELDVAVSTGVHTGEDVVKAILAGAKAAQVCTALYDGLGSIDKMNEYLAAWMDRHSFSSVEEFRGKSSYKKAGQDELFLRAQYMKFFPKG